MRMFTLFHGADLDLPPAADCGRLTPAGAINILSAHRKDAKSAARHIVKAVSDGAAAEGEWLLPGCSPPASR